MTFQLLVCKQLLANLIFMIKWVLITFSLYSWNDKVFDTLVFFSLKWKNGCRYERMAKMLERSKDNSQMLTHLLTVN